MAFIIWFDAKLLAGAQKLANWFAMLTGKNNFWLAKQLVFVTFILWVLQYYFDYGIFSVFVLYLFPCFIWLRIIQIQEESSEYYQQRNIKRDFRRQLMFRIGLVILAIWLNFFALISPIKWFHFTANFILVLAVYLSHLDKPPYAKSRILEWFRQLGRQPQPIQVKT